MPFSGHCLCGGVSYKYSGQPGDGIMCHCTHCRHYTGSVGSINLALEADKLEWVKKDSLTKFVDQCDRGAGPNRFFCNKCGSPIATTLDDNPAGIMIKAGSLDNFDQVFPEVKMHLYGGEIQHWFKKNYNLKGQKILEGMPGSSEMSV